MEKDDKEHEVEVLDIFEQAAMMSISNNKKQVELKRETMIIRDEMPKEIVNFKKLEKKMDNEFAQKFNDILHTLPDREFVRVYLKTLEFFKPKMTADPKGSEVTNNTINVVINK